MRILQQNPQYITFIDYLAQNKEFRDPRTINKTFLLKSLETILALYAIRFEVLHHRTQDSAIIITPMTNYEPPAIAAGVVLQEIAKFPYLFFKNIGFNLI